MHFYVGASLLTPPRGSLVLLQDVGIFTQAPAYKHLPEDPWFYTGCSFLQYYATVFDDASGVRGFHKLTHNRG